MSISKSGYYKWLKTRNLENRWEKQRRELGETIKTIYEKNESFGYHKIAAKLESEYEYVVSHNLVHKICKILKIRSKADHYDKKHNVKGKESIIYPNIIKNNWNVSRPFEIVVTDGTMITFKGKRYDWNYYVDVFDRSIVGSDVKPFNHGVGLDNHLDALNDMIENKIKRGYIDLVTTLHSDQGTIYSSTVFNDRCKYYNIKRSMSRAGTPTDNPIIESKNGWLKAEIAIEFNQNDYDTVEEYVKAIIDYNNSYRPSFPLKYKTPIQFRTELGFI